MFMSTHFNRKLITRLFGLHPRYLIFDVYTFFHKAAKPPYGLPADTISLLQIQYHNCYSYYYC